MNSMKKIVLTLAIGLFALVSFSQKYAFVDSKYIQKSGDTTYKEGQRIVVSGRDIESLVTILDKLGKAIEAESTNA